MKLTRLVPLLALLLAAAGCAKNPVQEPQKPEITLTNQPSSAKPLAAVEISAKVVSLGASIPSGGVELVWDNGAEQRETMESTSAAGDYSAAFTAPAAIGSKITYYVTASDSNGQSARSKTVTLTVTEKGPEEGGPAKLRLSEIGTFDADKFIEIYNPTELMTELEDVTLWKNGELMHTFTSADKIGAMNYGVLAAKGTAPYTGNVQNIGSTESGLSGTKSLSIELRYKGTVIDAFANTRNPDVRNSVWDGEPETEAHNFLRKDNGSDKVAGWFATSSSSTAGRANDDTGTRLKHQLFREDAVADAPYIFNLQVNPGTSPRKGVTAGSGNTIAVGVYTDEYSAVSSVKITVGSSTADMTKSDDGFTYTAQPTFYQPSAAVTIEAVNNSGGAEMKIADVPVFAQSTAFGVQADVRLNEINTDAKWIEIYNSSDKPVALSGMYFRKNKDRIFTIPSHMVLVGKGYALLGCKDNDHSGLGADLYLGTVSNGISGGKSLLIDLRDETTADIDLFSNSGNNDRNGPWDDRANIEREFTVVGRHPDASAGNTRWYVLDRSTPGKSNTTSTRGTEMVNQVRFANN